MRAELRPGRKLAAFAAALVAAFAVGWGVGAAVDPVIDAPEPPAGQHEPAPGHEVHP
jgi:hypothetical protein